MSHQPQTWIIGEEPFDSLSLYFNMPVNIPEGTVTARSHRSGPLTVTALHDGPESTFLDLAFWPPVMADRVTIVVDFSIVNEANEALDGEAGNPFQPTIPTGNGVQGGQAVFVFTVLQGDVNRDGTVNVFDSVLYGRALGVCQGSMGFDPHADVNGDGCVTEDDGRIIAAGFGGKLPRTEGNAPVVMWTGPETLPFPNDELILRFTEEVNPATLTEGSVFGVGRLNGELIRPAQPPSAEDNRTFRFRFDPIACLQDFDFVVSNAVASTGGVLMPFEGPDCGQCRFAVAGADLDPPLIACPEVIYVNSTEPFRIAASDVSNDPAIGAFLDGATATDTCGPVSITTSLDPAIELPLGVTMVRFTAVDGAQPPNAASCEAALIVVPSSPIFCWDLDLDGRPDVESEDYNGDGVVDQEDCRGINGESGVVGMPGIPGAPGAQGESCWDANSNGFADTAEDVNGDGTWDTLDCRGPMGDTGAPGPTGSPGSAGPAGPPGPPGPPGGLGTSGPTGILGTQGEQGPPGLQGPQGLMGATGTRGETGAVGATGGEGPPGLSCWDLNENGIAESDEDTNRDGQINVADCRGIDVESGAIKSANGALCGSLGLLNFGILFAGLAFFRYPRGYGVPVSDSPVRNHPSD